MQLRLKLRLSLLALLALIATPALAVWVRVVAIGPNYAQLEFNQSTVRTMRAGEQSPEGVRLISLSATHAEVQANGITQKLSLGQKMAPMAILQADARGHYLTDMTINGRRTRAVVDTGASGISLSRNEAERLGIAWQGGRQVTTQTAAGNRPGYVVTLDSVQVGSITLRNVDAVVSSLPDAPAITLLGMTFLGRVDMKQQGNQLQLMQLR